MAHEGWFDTQSDRLSSSRLFAMNTVTSPDDARPCSIPSLRPFWNPYIAKIE